VNELKAAMDAGFAEVDRRFAAVDRRFAEVDQRFAEVDQRFAQVDARFDALDERITRESETTRRHFDVVAEDLRSDMRMIADAVATMSTTLERHMSSAAVERTTVSAALDDHEVRLTTLERRRG